MATLCRPSIAVPDNVLTMEETLDLARTLHADHPQLEARAAADPEHRGPHPAYRPAHRQDAGAPRLPGAERPVRGGGEGRVPAVVCQALDNAGLGVGDIGLIVYVSCTGFMMPSLTAWLINTMGFSTETRQLPIAQLGCAAGGAAINRAHDFCRAYPEENALIVACEFCSLCYQPDRRGRRFTAVERPVRGRGGRRRRPRPGRRGRPPGAERLAPGPDTEDWISYAVKSTGFHFQLDKRVPTTMKMLAPALRALTRNTAGTSPGWTSTSCTPAGPGSWTTCAVSRRRPAHVPLQPGDAHRAGEHRQLRRLRRPEPALRGRRRRRRPGAGD